MAVKKDELELALRSLGYREDDARELSENVFWILGLHGFCADNALEKEQRSLLYYLEYPRLVTSSHEYATLPNGKEWSIYYWELNEKRIRELWEPNLDDVYITILLEIGSQFSNIKDAKLNAAKLRRLFSTNMLEFRENLKRARLEHLLEEAPYLEDIIKNSAAYMVVTDYTSRDLLRILENRTGKHIHKIKEKLDGLEMVIYKVDEIKYNMDKIQDSLSVALGRKDRNSRSRASIVVEEFYYFATTKNFNFSGFMKEGGKMTTKLSELCGFKVSHSYLDKIKIPRPYSKWARQKRDECILQIAKEWSFKASRDFILKRAASRLSEMRVPFALNYHSYARVLEKAGIPKRSKDRIRTRVLAIIRENGKITSKEVNMIASEVGVDPKTVMGYLLQFIDEGLIKENEWWNKFKDRERAINTLAKLIEEYIDKQSDTNKSYAAILREIDFDVVERSPHWAKKRDVRDAVKAILEADGYTLQ